MEVYSGIHDSLLNLMKEALDHLFVIKATEFDPVFFLLHNIYDNELFRTTYPDISPFYNELQEHVKVFT